MTIPDTLELSIGSQDADPERFIHDFEASIGRYGCAIISDHGLDLTSVTRAAASFKTFCVEAEAYKLKFCRSAGYGYRFCDFSSAAASESPGDLWQIGQGLVQHGPDAETDLSDAWPDRPSSFRDTMVKLYAEFNRVGEISLGMIARFLWLKRDWFVGPTRGSDSMLQLSRLAHLSRTSPKSRILGLGENVDLITLTFCTEDIEYDLRNRWDKSWNPVKLTTGSMLITIGSMMRRLTNDILMPPNHRTPTALPAGSSSEGEAIQFSISFRPDFEINIIPECFGSEGNHYPESILATDLKKIETIW